MTTGEKLQSLRKQNNYTQEELAEIMNVSRQSISKWESDVAFPETEKLIALSKLYNCSIDYLLKDNVDEPQNAVTNDKENNIKSYNKKRLPLIISTLGTYILLLFTFIPTWFTGSYAIYTVVHYDNGVMHIPTGLTYDLEANFYNLFTINGDPFVNAQALKVLSIILFILLLAIVIVSVVYIFVDKKALTKVIRIGNCLFLGIFIIFLILSIAASTGWSVAPVIACVLTGSLVLGQYIIKPVRTTH